MVIDLTGNSRMNIGIFFAIIAVCVIWFLLKKTTLGFEIRAVGLNPHVEYAGISTKTYNLSLNGYLCGVPWRCLVELSKVLELAFTFRGHHWLSDLTGWQLV